jgi:tetratricopeptide (TPR) repeat protein
MLRLPRRLGSLGLAISLTTTPLAVTLVGCQTMGAAAKPLKEAERLRGEGRLAEARAAYAEAQVADPKNTKIADRVRTLDEQVALEVERLRSEAKGHEKAGDFAAATKSYAQALELAPKDDELHVRRKLSAAKAKNLDPEAWYAEVSKIAEAHPSQPIVDRSLAGAKAGAYQYHLSLANSLLDGGDGSGALEHYDRAKALEPTMPGLDADKYVSAKAQQLVAQGDLRALAGDAVGAYELYEQSVALKPTPDARKKLGDAKARSAKLVQKLDAARAAAKKGRHQEALGLYDELASLKGVPASASTEAGEVRRKLSGELARDAAKAADRKDWKGAKAKLGDAVRYGEPTDVAKDALRLAVDQALDKRTDDARQTLVGAGLGADDPLFRGAEGIITAAERAFGKPKPKADPAEIGRSVTGALGDTTSTQMSGITAAEMRRLAAEGDAPAADDPKAKAEQKKKFQAALDAALAKAKQGSDAGASQSLLEALAAATAPDAVAQAARDGATALGEARYDDALGAFQGGLTAAPKSSLLQRGVDVARLRRDTAEKAALEAIRAGKAELGDAIAVLERARAARPGEPRVSEGAKLLTARVAGGAKLSDGELAERITQAARLTELSGPARAAVDGGVKKLVEGQYGDAEAAFADAIKAAPSAPLPEAAKKAASLRLLTALKAGAKSAASGDASATEALRKLMKTDPNSAEAKAGLDALLARAQASANEGNWSDAAKQLQAVTVVTDPAPGVKLALDGATDAMAASKLDVAERGFADALDLEPAHPGAKLGAEVTKKARLEGLKRAVQAAKDDGGAEVAAGALEKTLTVDPNSPEARQAFAALLDDATARGKAGKDREAARLLDAANVVSKPETAKKAIAAANALLADGRHADAEAAYAKVLEQGASKLAETGKSIARERRLGVVLAGVAKLADGSDLDRGAKAAKELLAIEPGNAEAKAAIDATLARAEAEAEAGRLVETVRALRAADVALGGTNGLPKVLADLERNKIDEAIDGFGRLSGRVADAGRDAAKKLKTTTLKQSMSSSDDKKAAESIRKVLAANPNDPTAKEALSKLLEKARAAGKQGDDKAAGAALEAATIASGAPEDLSAALKIGATQLGEGRYGEAEQAFQNARELARESKVAELGLELAGGRRRASEKAAAELLVKGTEPNDAQRRAAQVLRGTLVVDPKSKLVADASAKVEARAKQQLQKGPIADAARTLDVLAELEQLPAPMRAKLVEANAELAQDKPAEAEAKYAAATNPEEVGEVKPSKALELGRAEARKRLLAELRAGLDKAQKEKDLDRQRELVERILSIDPKDKVAGAERGKLGGAMADARYETAMAQKGLGKLGVAYVYLERALALNPKLKKAEDALAELAKASAGELDLVVRVDELTRAKGVAASACEGVETKVRAALMRDASQKSDLGFFVLGAEWTAKVDKNEPDAPKLGASLVSTLERCDAQPATASAAVKWQLVVPARGRGVLAEGTFEADVPAGLVPKDEQDPAAKNARELLAKRLGAKALEALTGLRSRASLWPLLLAEQGVAAKDAALAAEGYMKLKLTAPREVPTERLKALEAYLADALR